MKGQKSRAGAGIKPGFRGGDNRIWQLFPKQRGASKKPGGSGVYAKHRFYQLRQTKPAVMNVDDFNKFKDGETVNLETLKSKGPIKVLGNGELKRKINFEGFSFSKSAREKVEKAGGIIKN